MRTLLSSLLVAGVLAASGVVAVILHGNAVARARDGERDDARQAVGALERSLEATAFRLRGVAGLFEASESVSAPEFHAFTTPVFEEQHALSAILWMPRIDDRGRRAYERANQPITEGEAHARRTATRRATYFPIAYLETESPPGHSLGFDGAWDLSRRAAIRQAISLSRSQASAPVRLASSGRPGLVLYSPVFVDGVVPAAAARERTVQGVVAGAYRLDSLLAALHESVPAGTDLQVREDGKLISGPSQMDGGETSRAVDAVGRRWTVRASSPEALSLVAPFVALLVGGSLALLVAVMLHQAFTRERYARTLVDARMRERDAAQYELQLAQKLDAVGQLAAGIAHEINTPIQYIGDTSRFLNDAFTDLMALVERYSELVETAGRGPVPAEQLERVAEAAEQADLGYLRERVPGAWDRTFAGINQVAAIVGAMRTFGHPTTDKAQVDINAAIRDMLIVTANQYRYVADVHTELDELPPVVCNAGDLNQVLINLIVNAAHAIADVVGDSDRRGTIEIRTCEARDGVEITIGDTGGGIPADVAGRVFDPFFTTKEVGRGTGQGLAISRAIVSERHSGSITFTTEVGRGTAFTVWLPSLALGEAATSRVAELAT
jgi:signal transduction histidine kinase